MLVAWYGYPETETRGGILLLSRKRAGRDRFDRPKRILSEMSNSLGNPLLFCGEGERIHLIFVSLRGHYWDSAALYGCFSDNMGETWSQPEVIRVDQGMMVRYPPIVRSNTYSLLPAYDEKKNQTVMLTAGPDAQGWFPVEHFDDFGAIQGSIVRQDEKRLVMILRPVGDERVCLRSISADDGRSWSKIVRTTLPNPLSGVAAFQVEDTLCAVYNHTTEHQRYPLSLAHSSNSGLSWSDPKHIDETEHELSYPAFVVDTNGIAHGVYTFGRTRIRYVSFDSSWWKN